MNDFISKKFLTKGGKALLLSTFIFASSVNAEEPTKENFLNIVSDKVKMSGLLEVEAGVGKDFNKKNFSDITLATAQLGFDAEIQKWATGHLLFLYEEDGTDGVDVDEGTITLGGTEETPVFLTAGKMYVPFGVFDSSMISDPLTLSLAETNQSALQIGAKQDGWYASAYGFNCDVEEGTTDEPNKVECFGGNLGYAMEDEESGVSFGAEVGYLSNLVDSDSFEGYLTDSSLSLANHAGAYAISANVSIDEIKLIGEVVAASEDVEYASGVNAEKPVAYTLEVNYGFSMLDKDAVVAVGFQSSDKLGGFLPETRILGALNVALSDEIAAAIEYAHDEDYSTSEGGTNNGADTVTAQLSHGF